MKRPARSAAAILALVSPALAQDAKTSPLDAATASKADQPITTAKPGEAMTSDADILRMVRMLTGAFVSESKGDAPALRYSAAAVPIGGLDNAILFEIARADNAAEPFRVGVFHAYRRKGEIRFRVFDITSNPGLKDTLVGLWAASDVFPKMDVSALTPNLDMPMKTEGDAGFSGDTAQPVPTTRDGAIELTSSIRIGKDSIAFGDTGFDSEGKQVWGATNGERIVFKRATDSPVSVLRGEGGLTILTVTPPDKDAPRLVEGGEATVHYTGWLTNGTRFDSSRGPDKKPFTIHIPGPVIKGWNDGLKGIAKGERRRLIIPPAMGYADRGAGRGLIPPGATLVFDVECVFVDNSNPTPPVAVPGQPPPTTAPPPQSQQPGDKPFGKPPTSGEPEKPR